MLRFPYLEEPLYASAPPTLPSGVVSRWRPLVPIRVAGPTGRSRLFLRALVDSGSDDTVFPIDVSSLLGIQLLAGTRHVLQWRGKQFALQFGVVQLLLSDDTTTVQWNTTVAFTAAPIRYPLLGVAGCLQYLDVTFKGEDRIVEMEINGTFPGRVS